MNGLLVFPMAGGAVAFAVLAYQIGRRMQPRSRGLKPYYRRLGQVAPEDPCPCRRSSQNRATYTDCCRKRDVELFAQQVREFVWTDWVRRSGGRSRARSMKSRLEDYPMSEFSIPQWVAEPERFKFPIPEDTLRSWTPITIDPETAAYHDLDRSAGDSLPL